MHKFSRPVFLRYLCFLGVKRKFSQKVTKETKKNEMELEFLAGLTTLVSTDLDNNLFCGGVLAPTMRQRNILSCACLRGRLDLLFHEGRAVPQRDTARFKIV